MLNSAERITYTDRGGTRQFSACTPKQNDDFEGFDEEEEEDTDTNSSDMSRMVRERGKKLEAQARQKREKEQALMRQRKELQIQADQYANELRNASLLLQKLKQSLELIRRFAEEQRRAYEKWMRRYEQVITSSASSVDIASQVFKEYFVIRYPIASKVGSYINKNVMFIQDGEAEVSKCSQALRRIELGSRRIDLETRLNQLEASLVSTVEGLFDDHVTPAASAKRNIEKILEPLILFLSQYVELQEVGYRIRKSSRGILIACKNLGEYRFKRLRENIMDGALNIGQSLHGYRAMRRSLRWGGPLGKSHILSIVQNYFDLQVIRMLASDIEMDPDLLADEINTRGMSSLMAHWYFYRWKEGAPRSVDLDIAWKHFDIYYPFYMLYVSSRNLASEVLRLEKISEVMGDSTSEARFKEWKTEFDLDRQNFLSQLEETSYHTWLRLETEDKVSRLGGVPDTIAKGLFTPKDPPSSDPRRFFLCIDAICDGLSRSMNLDEATLEFDNFPDPTMSDVIELLDYVPSHKRGIYGYRARALGKGSKQEANAIKSRMQCGVSEPEIALIKKDQIVKSTDKDTAISSVSDAERLGIMSSYELLGKSDEPPATATDDTKPQFWSYNQYKTPDGGKIGIHYCKNLEHAERAAALFSDSKVLGFDIEWKPQAQISAGIKSNVSLIQIANEERIALIHIALFKGNEIQDLVPPSLKQLLESTNTVKVGQFELSHLYKLVKYGSTQPKLVDRRAVNLAQQVEELLGLPLRKDSDVRKSDWTKPLDYAQVQYAASDAYACICLYRTLEAKRKALNPVPPLPAFAELNLPILLAEEDKVEIEDKIAELSVRMKESLEVVDAGEEDVVKVNDEAKNTDSA
ncbi:uncharacterized protein BHQ10_009986 [Talaromyces amestolkiae]|uniref:3'-5' exonuclease domain-containing protein n=1 Tax=Talaromyces amestolkiae TaxID=1196081 RepID=A0A364LDT1_TALAM|nr:uncharacterized protein BHQ10_009986 [Talaromyces amestolkiae]RAO73974.1 hypothetical protein BHQ10_009986 [Talaromyces amestolkiae]